MYTLYKLILTTFIICLCSEIDCFQNLASPPRWFQPPVIIDVNFHTVVLFLFCYNNNCSDVGSKSVALIENVKESEDSEIANMVNPGKVKYHTFEKLL